MKNQFQLKLLVILVACVTFTFTVSQIGAWAYGATVSGEILTKGTKIASVSVEGLTKDEARVKVATEVDSWINTGDIQFVFGNVAESIAKSEALSFSVDQTIDSAVNGINNPLVVTWNKDKSINIIESISNKKWNEFNETKIQEKLLNQASNLTAGNLEVNVVEDLKMGESIVVSKAQIENVGANNEFGEWQQADIVIPPSTAFSLLNYIEEQGIDASNEVLSIIATGIYETILATNFEVVERHISDDLPGYARLGMEASIQQGKRDIIIFNKNPFEYRLDISSSDQGLKVELIGPAFREEYKVELGEAEVVKPKIIKHYDSTLSFGAKAVNVEGKDGSFISVNRLTLQSGKIIEKKLMSEDYYAPVHVVEVHSLNKNETTNPNGTQPSDDETQGNEDETDLEDNDKPNEDDADKKGETGKTDDTENKDDVDDSDETDKPNNEDDDDFWDDPEEMK